MEIDEKEAAKSPFTPGRGNLNGGCVKFENSTEP
jgi:hypothetical protein